MKRIWQIEEQTIEDPTTKLRLDFSSVHSDEVNAGNEPPSHDNIILMRMWDSTRTRIATFTFERNGRFISTDVEPVPGPADVAGVQPGEHVALGELVGGETKFVEPSPANPLGLPDQAQW